MTLYERDKEKFQEGLVQGIEQGIEQGVEQTKLENAKALLDVLEDEVIAKKIGLSLEIVKRLRNEV